MYQSFRPVLCFVKTLEPTRVLKLEIGAFLMSIREREREGERESLENNAFTVHKHI